MASGSRIWPVQLPTLAPNFSKCRDSSTHHPFPVSAAIQLNTGNFKRIWVYNSGAKWSCTPLSHSHHSLTHPLLLVTPLSHSTVSLAPLRLSPSPLSHVLYWVICAQRHGYIMTHSTAAHNVPMCQAAGHVTAKLQMAATIWWLNALKVKVEIQRKYVTV